MIKRPKTHKFRCWVLGRRAATEEIIEAASGWEARQVLAEKHAVSVTETAARRLPKEGR